MIPRRQVGYGRAAGEAKDALAGAGLAGGGRGLRRRTRPHRARERPGIERMDAGLGHRSRAARRACLSRSVVDVLRFVAQTVWRLRFLAVSLVSPVRSRMQKSLRCLRYAARRVRFIRLSRRCVDCALPLTSLLFRVAAPERVSRINQCAPDSGPAGGFGAAISGSPLVVDAEACLLRWSGPATRCCHRQL